MEINSVYTNVFDAASVKRIYYTITAVQNQFWQYGTRLKVYI